METKYGICSVCRRKSALKKNGQPRHHIMEPGAWRACSGCRLPALTMEEWDMKPKQKRVNLNDLMNDGVLMAANERFFWPLGLALTWRVIFVDGVPQDAKELFVTEWAWSDGHHEAIGLAPDDQVAIDRRARFAKWVDARIASLPAEEQPNALVAVAGVATPIVQPTIPPIEWISDVHVGTIEGMNRGEGLTPLDTES